MEIKVSDFDFGVIEEVEYTKNGKQNIRIGVIVKEILAANKSISRAEFKTMLLTKGFTVHNINSAITRFKNLKELKINGNNIERLK